MVTAKMEALYEKLLPMSPAGLQISHRKDWITFQTLASKRIRNAVTIKSEGVSFFTENSSLLNELEAEGVESKPIADEGKKHWYRFTNLTPDLLDKYSIHFSKLFEESVRLVLHSS